MIRHIINRSFQLWLPRLLSDYSHLRFNSWGVNHFTQALTQNPPPPPPNHELKVEVVKQTYHFDRSKNYKDFHLLFFLLCCGPMRAMASSFSRFLDHTQRRTTLGRTPLDEFSARRRDSYLKTHNTHNRQISIPPVGFEPTISAGERPQTNALDRTARQLGPANSVITTQKFLRRVRKYDIVREAHTSHSQYSVWKTTVVLQCDSLWDVQTTLKHNSKY